MSSGQVEEKRVSVRRGVWRVGRRVNDWIAGVVKVADICEVSEYNTVGRTGIQEGELVREPCKI